MKVKEKDLVIGDEYWFDTTKNDKGIFITIETSNIDEYVYYKQVKLMEIYEVEL